MSDEATALRMLNLCRHYKLSGTDLAEGFTAAQLAAMFNGIGPESWPQVLRDALDNLAADLLPTAFIHDIRFATGDGTREDFERANKELRENGEKIAAAKYVWYDPRRYITRRRARTFANLCQCFGWGAYQQACRASALASTIISGECPEARGGD